MLLCFLGQFPHIRVVGRSCRIMSRRKQANPRPLKAIEDENLQATATSYKPFTTSNLTEDVVEESLESDPDDFDEYGPLVVDTSRQDDDETGDKEQGELHQQSLYTSGQNSDPFQDIDKPKSPSEDSRRNFLPRDLEDSNSSPAYSRTPSISSLDQLSPGGLSSSISTSKTHRRGKRNHSLSNEQEFDPQDVGDQTEAKILPVASESGDSRYICPICSELLSSSHDLTVHIRSHNTTNPSTQGNSCTICGKILSSQSSLDRHMLVHSGERPFKCKYCKMSFTTNGNMHRHMRIHTKETELGALGGKNQRKRVPSWKPKMNFIPIEPAPSKTPNRVIGLPSPHIPREGTPEAYTSPKGLMFNNTTPSDIVSPGMKRAFNFVNSSPEWKVPTKQPRFEDSRDAVLLEKHSAKILSHNGFHSGDLDQSESALEIVEGEEKDVDQLHCPVCSKTFLCKYGLESHLETHQNLSLKCNTCHMSFPTLRGLDMHKLMLHSKTKTPNKEGGDMKDEVKSAAAAAVIGFYDMDFVDFSVKKFSLIAKSWCEANARKSSSVYHNFICKECAKAFPCKSALKLHMNTHNQEKTSQCPICDCDYMGTRELHMHMIKHMSDKAFDDAQSPLSRRRETHSASNSDKKESKAEEIGKHDFLAAYGLTANVSPLSEVKPRPKQKKELPTIQNLEKAENNDYFAKLGQVFSPSVSPVRQNSKTKASDDSMDFADIQKILQNAKADMMSGFQGSGLEQSLSVLNPSQMAAFMPSLMQGMYGLSPMSPSTAIPTMAAMINASRMMNSLTGGNMTSSPLPTPPTSESGNSSTSLSPGEKNQFPCKYCDLVFPNYRTLKGHTRSHLGLSPYKCNLCSYSSADKSTLIRHLRTHNGERPFQCRVCDFAFTTKANCERHVRKKHGKIMKDEIESAIGYNKYVSEDSNCFENFHSPDTVCKYCGVDFKFFRALKHHLRSHSSCRQKPFQCTKCEVGFSTKANCIRHLQKQHTEISYNQIEQYIVVHEPSLLEDGDKSQGDSVSDDGMMSDNGRDTSTPSSMSNSVPPAAHSTPKLGLTPDSSRQGSPAIIKIEPVDPDDEDRPLDFSKTSTAVSSSPASKKTTSNSEELPMDLSIRRTSDIQSLKISNKVAYDNNLFQCKFCPMGFSNQRVLERHTWQHHPQVASTEKCGFSSPISKTTDSKIGIMGNLKLPLKPPVITDKFKEDIHTVNKLPSVSPKILLKQKIKKEPMSPNSYGSDSNNDLASVTKILNATRTNQFQAFLADNIGDSDSQSREEAVDEEDEDMEMPEIVDMEKEDSPLNIIEEPPVLSPRTKGDNHRKSELEEADMNRINKIISNELRQQIQKAKEAENAFSVPNAPMEKQQFKKKRNSYADSPHKLHCPYCTRTFPWVSSLTRHLLTHTGQKPFKCPRCPVTFSTKSNRERHLIRKHGVNMLDPLSRQTMDRPYKCHMCVFSSFSTQGNLLKHYKERHNDCDLPDSLVDLDRAVTVGLATTLTGEERIAARDKALGVLDSDSTYESEEQLNQSIMESEHPDDRYLTIEPNGNCNDFEDEEDDASEASPSPVPQAIINTEDVILVNKPFSGSAERQINPERDNYNVDKITECWKCSEKFVSRKLLVRHLKEHNIDLPFKCYLCDASFDLRLDCLEHQEKFHSSDWSILKEKNKVDVIGDFSKHMDKVVENNCNKVDQGVVLEIPGQNADDPKMEVVSADYMQRKVYCSLCPKRFWSLQDLRRHMRSHTGERPFECDICQKRFTLKHSMMRHRKKHMESGSLSPSDDEDTSFNSSNIATTSVTATPKIKGPRLLPKMPPLQPMPQLSQVPPGIPVHLSRAIPISVGTTEGTALTTIPVLSMPTIHLSSSVGQSLNNNITLKESLKKGPAVISRSSDNSKDNDILHSLLGVEMGSIDQMLDSADSAAMLLGVQ